MNIMLRTKKIIAVIICVLCLFSISSSSLAKSNNRTILSEGVFVEEGIDPEIVALYDDYSDGKIDGSKKVDNDIEAMFINSLDIQDDIKVDRVYNVKQIGVIDDDTLSYEATALTIVTLENTTQDVARNIVIFNSTRFYQKTTTNGVIIRKLNRIKTGVLTRDTNYFCEGIKFSWGCLGPQYTDAGVFVKKSSESVSFGSGYDVFWPEVGKSYYRYVNPTYYYDTSDNWALLCGDVKARIMPKHANTPYTDLFLRNNCVVYQ